MDFYFTLCRQDSWFQYLFGVKEPGFFGGINVANQKAFLFIPRLPDEYRLWCGKIYPPEYFKELYKVDEVLFVDEIEKWIQTQDDFPTIYLLEGINSDSGFKCKPANLPNISSFKNNIDKTILHTALALCRVTKSTIELSLLQYCAYVASMAHVQVMRIARPGAIEYEFEALFQYEIYKNGGCRNVAYTSICGCGPNSAVLHYGHAAAANTRQVEVSDIALLDMGADYHGYKSDITCSVSISFTISKSESFHYKCHPF
jgi:Xaa-Pro dipeptidase